MRTEQMSLEDRDSDVENNYAVSDGDDNESRCGRGPARYEEEESNDELLRTNESNKVLIQGTVPVAPQNARRSKNVLFHEEHPQFHSHHVHLLDEKDSYVPNFIGGSLPRKDAGSREEYCMTMLTLFKPWRTGKDLRPNLETTWSDVFNQHQFTDRQLEIMKFFHIRYECNDARLSLASCSDNSY